MILFAFFAIVHFAQAIPLDCNEIAFGFHNPVDPKHGIAWPLQGKQLPREIQVVSPRTTYRLFRLLREDTSQSDAYLALDSSNNPVVVKHIKDPESAFREVAEIIVSNDIIQKKGYKTAAIQETFSTNDSLYMVQDYVPGLNGVDFFVFLQSNDELLSLPDLLDVVNGFDQLRKKILLWQISDEALEIIAREHLFPCFDDSEENFVYFNGEWVWIDP